MLIRKVESKDCKVKLVIFDMGINKFKIDISVAIGNVVFAVIIKFELLKEHITGSPEIKHEILSILLNWATLDKWYEDVVAALFTIFRIRLELWL